MQTAILLYGHLLRESDKQTVRAHLTFFSVAPHNANPQLRTPGSIPSTNSSMLQLSSTDLKEIQRAQRESDKLQTRRNLEQRREAVRDELSDWSAPVPYRFVCSNCDCDELELDQIGGVWICVHCGFVPTDRYHTADLGISIHKPRHSSPYSYCYHLNEVWAAYKGRGPVVHEDDMDRIQRYIQTTWVHFTARTYYETNAQDPAAVKLNPLLMNRPHYMKVCKLCGLKNLGERWVQIKKKLCGADWRIQYPTADEENAIRIGFGRFCIAFNQLFYTAGKKRTSKDNSLGRPKGELSRHNLPHYNWIIQHVAMLIDPEMKVRCELDTFFPLQKTQQVRKKLNLIWVLVCKHLKWPLTVM